MAVTLRAAVEAARCQQSDLIQLPSWAHASTRDHSIAGTAKAGYWNRVPANAHLHNLIDRRFVARTATKFHERAGTLTPAVQSAITALEIGTTPVVRIAHTPDWLPYRSVALLPVLLNALTCNRPDGESDKTPVQVFLSVDVDVGQDRRLRNAVIPDFTSATGNLVLGNGLRRSQAGLPLARLASPTPEAIDDVIQSIQSYLHRHERLGAVKHTPSPFQLNEAWLDDLRFSVAAAETLAEFHLIWLSRLINLHWAIPTVFVSQCDAAPAFYGALPALENMLEELSTGERLLDKGSRYRAFWALCAACGQRTPAGTDGRNQISEICRGCGRQLRIDLDASRAHDSGIDCAVPRLRADTAMDVLGWNFALGVSYLGSADHVLKSMGAMHRAGWQPPPDVLWSARGSSLDLAAARMRDDRVASSIGPLDDALTRARSGRASVCSDLLAVGVSELADAWTSHLNVAGLNTPLDVGDARSTGRDASAE